MSFDILFLNDPNLQLNFFVQKTFLKGFSNLTICYWYDYTASELILMCIIEEGNVVFKDTRLQPTVLNIRSDEGLTLETSALYSLRWPIYIFNLVDITKLRFKHSFFPPWAICNMVTIDVNSFIIYSYSFLSYLSFCKFLCNSVLGLLRVEILIKSWRWLANYYSPPSSQRKTKWLPVSNKLTLKQVKLLFALLVIQLVWYILKQLFTSVSVKVVDIFKLCTQLLRELHNTQLQI